MNIKRTLLSTLPHAALGWGSVLASLFCTISAFSLPVDTGLLLGVLAVSALLWAFVFTLPKRALTVPAALLVHLGFFVLQRDRILTGSAAVFNEVFSHWSKCYGWFPEIQFSNPGGALDISYFFLLFGVLAIFASMFSLCRCDNCLLSVFVTLPFFAVSITVVNYPPDPVFVVCLLGLVALLILTQAVRCSDTAAAGRLSLLLAVPVGLFCALLLTVLPADAYQRGELPNRLLEFFTGESFQEYLSRVNTNGGGTISGILPPDDSRTVDFSDLGTLRQSSATVMTVNTAESQTLYLRGVSMGDYTQTGWSAADETVWDINPLLYASQDDRSTEVTIQTRTLHDIVYLPYYSLRLPTGTLFSDSAVDNTEQAQEYTALLVPSDSSAARQTVLSWNAPYEAYDQYVSETYTRLPDSTREAMLQLAAQAGITGDSAAELAGAVADFYQSNGVYALNPKLVPEGEDFAPWFTSQAMRGYCVHYATCAAVMLRALGVPARYVTGYVAEAEAGEDSVVTGKNAHAWVEYYQEGFGWVCLEVTPAAGRVGSQQPTVPSESVTEPVEPSGSEPTASIAEPSESPDASAPSSGQTPSDRTQTDPEASAFSWHWWYALVLAVPVLAACFVLRRKLLLRARARRLASAAPNRRAELLWSRVLRISRKTGLPVDPDMEQLALKAKFSSHQLSQQEVSALRSYARQFREQALSGMNAAQRFRANWLWVL